MLYAVFIAILGLALTRAHEGPVFSNPISWSPIYSLYQSTILRVGSFYYMTTVNGTWAQDELNFTMQVIIRRSPVLTSFNESSYSVPFEARINIPLAGGIMHEIDGSLYLYFSKYEDPFGSKISTYYMKAKNSSDPMGTWTEPQPLFEVGFEHRLLDGTVMKHDGRLYYIGTQYFTDFPTIYIYPMESPTKINRYGTRIREPKESWECYGSGTRQNCAVHAPFVISNKEVNYMVFSATRDYEESSLSYMSISSGQNPMNISEWNLPPGPVFSSSLEENMLGVRSASFTLSPDGTETWMLFHSSTRESHSTALPSIEKIEWNDVTGEPEFPTVHEFGHTQPVPAGQT